MLIERTSYHPKTGQFDSVLALREKACEVRRDLGLKMGNISIEHPATDPTTSADSRIVHWDCAFRDEQEQANDFACRGNSAAFRDIRAQMKHLIDDFRRALVHPVNRPGSLTQTSIEDVAIVPRELAFRSGDLTLTGYLYLPPGAGPFPCMVTNHGSSIHQGTSDVCRPGVAAVLMSWGIASFLPHRRGYGNSPGTPWREDVSADFGTETYDQQLSARLSAESGDVVSALEFLESRPEIDKSHIGVMGSSFGGTVTLFAASACPRFRCAVEFAGAAMNWDRTPGLRLVMHEAAAKLTQPTFFVQAENDYSIRPTIELAKALNGSKTVIASKVYPGFGLTRDEGHFLYGQGTAVWANDVRAFLEQWL